MNIQKKKIRKKPCRHCLFTNNAVVDRSDIDYQRSVAVSGDRLFRCHEHSCNTVICQGAYKRRADIPEPEVEFISYNGDLKHKFSNMTREEFSRYRVSGS